MPSRDEQLIDRMVVYCTEIAETIQYFGSDFNRFSTDFIMRNALSMPLQQIGELATHVTDGFISAHQEIPWKQIKGMRTWFAHQYWDMSIERIWYTLTVDVPELKRQLNIIRGQS